MVDVWTTATNATTGLMMNAQIKLLSEQAIEYADYYAMLSGGKEQEIFTEKFAELIVRECILTIQMGITRDGHNTEKYLRSIKHIKQIKQHFGVEE